MTQHLSRSAYRLILRLHPAPFRARFAAEMLGIFDAESQRGATARLLFDCVLSAIRQHAKVEDPEPVYAGFPVLSTAPSTGPGITPVRALEAGLSASLIAGVFLFFAAQCWPIFPPGSKPKPAAPRHQPPTLYYVPGHIQPLSKILQ